jgi:hypothetical protein
MNNSYGLLPVIVLVLAGLALNFAIGLYVSGCQ